MASLRCHGDSDDNKTQIIRNFHLYIIQLRQSLFHIFTHDDVVTAQIWEVSPAKNPFESPKISQVNLFVTCLSQLWTAEFAICFCKALSTTLPKFHWFFKFKTHPHFIIGVPFQPEPSAVKNRPCGTFEVTWNPPVLDSGGGPLTGYQVELQPFESRQITDESWRHCRNFLANHSCLFGGLRSETEYLIRVRAVNQKGPGQWAYTSKRTDIIGKLLLW